MIDVYHSTKYKDETKVDRVRAKCETWLSQSSNLGYHVERLFSFLF